MTSEGGAKLRECSEDIIPKALPGVVLRDCPGFDSWNWAPNTNDFSVALLWAGAGDEWEWRPRRKDN